MNGLFISQDPCAVLPRRRQSHPLRGQRSREPDRSYRHVAGQRCLHARRDGQWPERRCASSGVSSSIAQPLARGAAGGDGGLAGGFGGGFGGDGQFPVISPMSIIAPGGFSGEPAAELAACRAVSVMELAASRAAFTAAWPACRADLAADSVVVSGAELAVSVAAVRG